MDAAISAISGRIAVACVVTYLTVALPSASIAAPTSRPTPTPAKSGTLKEYTFVQIKPVGAADTALETEAATPALLGAVALPIAEYLFKWGASTFSKYLDVFEAKYSGIQIVDFPEMAQAYKVTFVRGVAFDETDRNAVAQRLKTLDLVEFESRLRQPAPDNAHPGEGKWNLDVCTYQFNVTKSQSGKSVRFTPTSLIHLRSKAKHVPNLPLVAHSQLSVVTTLREATTEHGIRTGTYLIPPVDLTEGVDDMVKNAKNKKPFSPSDWFPAPDTGAFSLQVEVAETNKTVEQLQKALGDQKLPSPVSDWIKKLFGGSTSK